MLTTIKQFTLPLISLIAILIGFQCQAPYEIDDLDSSLKIPVFNAVLTNVSTLNSFSLVYATPFGTSTTTGISGATITIYEDGSPLFDLVEDFAGRYILPDNAPDLKTNSVYKAEISMPNGETLVSDDMTLYDTISINNYYIKEGLRTELVKNSSGNYDEINEYGIFVYAELNQPTTDVYLRSSSDYYVHSQKHVENDVKSEVVKDDTIFTYTTHYDTLYDIYVGFVNNEWPELTSYLSSVSYTREELKQSPLFLVADEGCWDYSSYTDYTFIEWVVPVDIYRHEETVYDYYIAAEKQLETENQIYDPIPEQIIGNMHNSSSSDETVLGLFDVSAVNRKYLSVYAVHGVGFDYYASKLIKDTIISSGTYYNYSTSYIIGIDTTIIEK